MPNELLIRLRDAGFPQKKNEGKKGRYKYMVYEPNLSELIEACGYQFAGLERHSDATFYAYSKENGEPNNISLGLTPKEAVSELFIALNQK